MNSSQIPEFHGLTQKKTFTQSEEKKALQADFAHPYFAVKLPV